MSGSNQLDFIKHYLSQYGKYSDDKKTVHGAYGPRLFGAWSKDQLERVIDRLRERGDTRKAVVQLFDRTDLLVEHKDVPCTCTLQFLLRNGHLSLHAMMRSNDAFKGLPHDIFAFTMIQEYVARRLGVHLGDYRHYAGSFHLYDADLDRAKKFLDEGLQQLVRMPRMPDANVQESLTKILEIERKLRTGAELDVEAFDLDPYWMDLARILEIHAHSKSPSRIPGIYRRMHDREVYRLYVIRKVPAKELKHIDQQTLMFEQHGGGKI